MATGRGFSAADRLAIDKAIRDAERLSRFEFSVYVGAVEGDPGEYAVRLLGALVAPSRSVLVAVDPDRRVVQVVTGAEVARVLTDRSVGLAVLAMQSSFAAGDYVGGLTQGLSMLAEHATEPETLHAS